MTELNQALAAADNYTTKAERCLKVIFESAGAKKRKELEPAYTAISDAGIQITRAIAATNGAPAPNKVSLDISAIDRAASNFERLQNLFSAIRIAVVTEERDGLNILTLADLGEDLGESYAEDSRRYLP